MLEMAQIFTQESCMPNRRKFLMLDYFYDVGTMFHGHVQWTKTVKSIEFENFLISDSRT